jgi:hypothetical protein
MASSVNRFSGRYCICQLGNTNAVLQLTDWRVQVRTEFVDGTGFGDFWDVPVPIKYLWTARAGGLFGGGLSYLEAYHVAQTGTSDILSATFIGFADTGSSVPIFRGTGFTELAAFRAPQSMVEQEIEIRGTGAPSLVT